MHELKGCFACVHQAILCKVSFHKSSKSYFIERLITRIAKENFFNIPQIFFALSSDYFENSTEP